jgi:hypothetical protein
LTLCWRYWVEKKELLHLSRNLPRVSRLFFWLCRVFKRMMKPTDHSYWSTSCFSGRIYVVKS